jgi:hypothetical protein
LRPAKDYSRLRTNQEHETEHRRLSVALDGVRLAPELPEADMTRAMKVGVLMAAWLAVWPVVAYATEEAQLEGVYSWKGVDGDGTEIGGFVQVVRHGESFLVAWMSSQDDLVPAAVGVGVADKGMLAVLFYGPLTDAVVLYRIEDGKRRLVGRWVAAGGDGAVNPDLLIRVEVKEPARAPRQPDDSTKAMGYWSAVLATVFSMTYVFAQLAEWAGWLGSQGGPESASTPLGIVVLLTPSIFLGSSFLVLTICIHQIASPGRRVWSHAAVAFATIYTALISIVYFVQLTLVGPRLASGRVDGIEMFLFVPFDSFLYAVDILGYSFMSVATLFAAMVFTGRGLERVARTFMIANGLLLPFIALQMYFHALIWIAALWAVTFPVSTSSLALLFRRATADASAGIHQVA